MSDVLLVDYEITGHHLKYAASLLDELDRQFPMFDFQFLTVGPDPRIEEYFEASDVTYLFSEEKAISRPGAGDILERLTRRPMWNAVGRTINYAEDSQYDIVHFLHVDNLLQALWKYSKQLNRLDSSVVGSINGAFFGTKSFPSFTDPERLLGSLEHVSSGYLLRYLPNLFSYRRPWKDAFLSQLLGSGTFDELFVPTESGRRYLDELRNETETKVVPDPIELPSLEQIGSKADARDELDILRESDVLLFFGELRSEKGIRILLDALHSYDGKEFTMVFAGEPVDVDPSDIASLDRNPDVTVRQELSYISESDVRHYFVASDGVVLPYTTAFGKHRPSNVFNLSCGYGRPVIAPNFGIFSSAITKHDLGITYEPDESEELARAIDDFLGSHETFSARQIQEYAETQTYGELAARIGDTYVSVVQSSQGRNGSGGYSS